MSETTRPRTETGRTFLSMLETQDRLMALPGKVDWAHGIRAIEEAAAAEARAGLVAALGGHRVSLYGEVHGDIEVRCSCGEWGMSFDGWNDHLAAALAAPTTAPDPSDAR